MNTKEKWAKYDALQAEANRKYAEWRALCKEIDALVMTRPDDQPNKPHRKA